MTEIEIEVIRLRGEIGMLNRVVEMLISWIVQSANSPLRISDAEMLLRLLEEGKGAARED